MMPLAMAKSGETVVMRKITGKDSIRQHLAELETGSGRIRDSCQCTGRKYYPSGKGQPDCAGSKHGNQNYGLSIEDKKGRVL